MLKTIPKIKACFFLTFPEGMGLRQVLDITASRSASYHMLRVPAAPAPIATAIKEIDELTKLMFSGEIIIPTMHVNITRDITLGFISFRNDLIIVANSDVKFFSFAKMLLNLFYFRKLFKSMKWWWRRNSPF